MAVNFESYLRDQTETSQSWCYWFDKGPFSSKIQQRQETWLDEYLRLQNQKDRFILNLKPVLFELHP